MYVNGFILAVPEANKAAYKQVAEKFWEIVKDYGAKSQIECWEVDVPDGEATDFRRAVQCREGEKIVSPGPPGTTRKPPTPATTR
jgi:uncharacterized protein YbaA (DUF1428 family)